MSKDLKNILKLDEGQLKAVCRAAKEDRMPIRKLLQDAVYTYLEYRRVELGRLEQ